HGISRKPQTFDKGSLRWWQGDLANFDVVRSLLMEIKPDLIFHLTTHGQGAPGLEHVLPTLRNDVLATINVLTAAAELKLRRLVVTASLEEPETSDSEIIPSSPYAAAKWTSSTYARMFHRLYGTPIVLTRIFMTYGPGQSMHKLIPYVIRCLLTG